MDWSDVGCFVSILTHELLADTAEVLLGFILDTLFILLGDMNEQRAHESPQAIQLVGNHILTPDLP